MFLQRLMILVLALSSCGNSNDGQDTSPPIVSAQPKVCQKYSFNLLEPCSKITDQNLTGADLKNINLQGSILRNVRFNKANLSGANFQDTDLRSVDFSEANLQLSDLSGSVMDDSTNFTNADLRAAYFVRSNALGKLEVSALQNTRRRGATIDIKTVAMLDFESSVAKSGMVFKFLTSGPSDSLTLIPGFKISLATNLSDHPISAFNRQYLGDVFEDLNSFKFKVEPQNLFYKFFGSLPGTTPVEKLKNYVATRVKYFLHDNKNEKTTGAQTIAYNATANWLYALFNGYVRSNEINSDLQVERSFRHNGQKIMYSNSSVQVVELGNLMFFGIFSSLSKVSTILHEARHSDCLAIPTASEMQVLSSGKGDPVMARAALQKCHQGHVKCPKGHSLAGEYACDDYAWGSYTASMLVDNYIAQNCESCSTREKLQALAKEKDYRTRVLVLSEILNGTAGEPNLNHVAYTP